MKRDKILNGVGFSLLAAAFLFSLINHFSREEKVDGETVTTIRFAHWRLEEPTLKAFQWAADEYSRRHPGVKVVQMDIPLRTWPMWMHSQLIGETAPDIMAYHGAFLSDTELARHFIPLSEAMSQPNPHNQGTPLDGVPWHKTFANDLNVASCFRPQLLDFYAIPTTTNLMRLIVNRDLLERIAGVGADLPESFEDFVALQERTEGYDPGDGSRVFLIAGSRERSYPLLSRFSIGVTQAEFGVVNWNYDETVALPDGDLLRAHQRDAWDWDNPRTLSAFGAFRALMRMQIPAFQQQRQDDALFYFLQERALALPVFAIDAQNIERLATFTTAIVPEIPLPQPGSEPFGLGTLGPYGEGASGYAMPFAVTRYSENREIAIDFMRFLTSWDVNPEYSRISGLSPVLPDLPPEIAPRNEFSPNLEGLPGMGIQLFTTGMNEMMGLLDSRIHRFTDLNLSVEALVDELKGPLWEAYATDLEKTQRQQEDASRRLDSVLAAYSELSSRPDTLRLNALMTQQVEQEAASYRLGLLLQSLSEQNQP